MIWKILTRLAYTKYEWDSIPPLTRELRIITFKQTTERILAKFWLIPVVWFIWVSWKKGGRNA